MKKNANKTVDAQLVKSSLMKVANQIGRRKRLRVGAFFELMLEAMSK